MERCATVPHVNMEVIVIHMVTIPIHAVVMMDGMELIVSMRIPYLHALMVHALIMAPAIPLVHMAFIALVPMVILVNNVSTFKFLFVHLHHVLMEVLVMTVRLRTFVLVQWVIMAPLVKCTLVKQHVVLLHVKTWVHVMIMGPHILVVVRVDIMARTVK